MGQHPITRKEKNTHARKPRHVERCSETDVHTYTVCYRILDQIYATRR